VGGFVSDEYGLGERGGDGQGLRSSWVGGLESEEGDLGV